MNTALRAAFFALVVRPVLTIALGAHVRRRELLPTKGPAIIVANHNSHLDTLTILAMYPLRTLPHLRPVAAADYFLRTKLMGWFALNIIGIVPIDRTHHEKNRDPLAPCYEALDRGDILILFPEGSRGEPEMLSQFKKGIAHLARTRPDVPIHPLFIYGLGKALPKGRFVLIPFNCDIVAGEPLCWNGSIDGFMDALNHRMTELAATVHVTPWE